MPDEGGDTLIARGEAAALGLDGGNDFSLMLERTGPSTLQVIRGVGGLGGIWAGAWAGMGLIFSLVLSVIFDYPMGLVANVLLPTIVSWGVSGFLAGAGFGTLLTAIERRKTLDELSLGRVAVWGAIGGAAVSVLVLSVMAVLAGFENLFLIFGAGGILLELAKAALFGTASAVATTVLARSARDEPGAGTLEEEGE